MSVTINGIIYPIVSTTHILVRPPGDGWGEGQEGEGGEEGADFQLVLPENIGDLIYLEEFDIGFCQVKRIPESIGNLINLEVLYLNDNDLTSLPESIGNLTNLKKLSLSMNGLLTLPETIGNLINLTFLDLTSNTRLMEIPYSIGKLPKLKNLYIMDTGFARYKDLNYATTKTIKNFLTMTLQKKQQQERTKMKTAIVSALRGTPMNHDNLIDSIDMAFPDVVDREGRKITARDMLNEYLNKFATQQGGDIYGKYHVGKSSFKFKELSIQQIPLEKSNFGSSGENNYYLVIFLVILLLCYKKFKK